MLSAGFSIGRNNAKEAAISGGCLANWESFANRPRRKSPAGAPRPKEIARGGSPQKPLCGGCCQTPPSANADTSPFRGGLQQASALGAITPQKPL